MSERIICAGCSKPVEVEPDSDGQVSCPECGGFFPLAFAQRLEAFESERREREEPQP